MVRGTAPYVLYCLNDMDVIADQSFFGLKVQGTTAILLYLVALLLLKVLAANLTQGAGGNGGMFAPSLFVGAAAGYAFAR